MMELEALQAVWPQLRALGASLIAISPQLGQYGRAVRRRAKIEFDVLTDLHLRVAEAFGLAFTLPPDLKELYAAFGDALDKFHDEPDFRLPRSEEHTSELQSPCNLVCRLLLEKKKKNKERHRI